MIPLIAPAGMALLKLAGGTAALSGAGLGVYGLSQIPGAVEEGILKAGPNDPDDPTKFKTNPLQDWLIDEGKLSDKYFKRQQNRLYRNDPKVRARLNLLGQKKTDIGFREADAYLADTKEEAERLTTNKNLTKELQGMSEGGAIYAELGKNPTNAQLRRAIKKADERDRFGGGRGTLIAQEQIAADNRAEEKRRYNLERLDQNQLLMLQQQNAMADREDRRLDRQMQNRLNERRLDLQEARDFRKDRQMAIMQIVKGFREMGNAFAY